MLGVCQALQRQANVSARVQVLVHCVGGTNCTVTSSTQTRTHTEN